MAIVYPLSLPVSPAPSHVAPALVKVASISESPYTLGQQVQEQQGERWELQVAYPTMDRNEAEPVLCTLLALKGCVGTLLFGWTRTTKPRGLATGTPVVHGALAAGATDLVFRGLPNSTSGVLRAGDYIQLVGAGGRARLHKLMFDLNSDSSGHATASIRPALREAAADGATIIVRNCVGQFRLAENRTAWPEDTMDYTTLDFKLIEDLT